jgi:hypothetical protein
MPLSARARRRIAAISRLTGVSREEAVSVFLVENGARPAALVRSGADMTRYRHPRASHRSIRYESDEPNESVVVAAGERVPPTLLKRAVWDDLKDNVALARLLGYRDARKDFSTWACSEVVLVVSFEFSAAGDGRYEPIVGWYAARVPAEAQAMLQAMQGALGCPVRLVVTSERFC